MLPRRRSLIQHLAVSLLVLGPAVLRAADEPVLTALLPSGGQRGTSVSVQAIGNFPQWPPQVWSSSDHIHVRPGSSAGSLQVDIDAHAAPGPHWIRLYDADGATALRPFVVDSVAEVTEPDKKESPQPVAVSLPCIANGRLTDRNEVDTYQVHLEEGQMLVAAVWANRQLGSPMDAVLQLVSADQEVVIEQDDDSLGVDPRIVYSVARSGNYRVRVFAFPVVPTSSISFAGGDDFVYRLALSASGAVDHAYPLAAGPDQHDQIRLVGWDLPTTRPETARIPVSSGELLQAFCPSRPGWFDIALRPYACLWETDDCTLEAPLVAQLPQSISGYLSQPGDADAVEFAGRKDERIRLQIESRSLGFWMDPVLEIVDADGKTLARQDDAGDQRDCRLDFEIPADGNYRVVIRDLHEQGGERFAYRLSMTRNQPNFQLTVESDRFAGKAGEALSIPVSVDFDEGFEGVVELRADGLSEGVQASAVTASPGEKRKVQATITLESDGPLGSPLRITGSVAGSADLNLCTAPTPVDAFHTTDLWVTFR